MLVPYPALGGIRWLSSYYRSWETGISDVRALFPTFCSPGLLQYFVYLATVVNVVPKLFFFFIPLIKIQEFQVGINLSFQICLLAIGWLQRREQVGGGVKAEENYKVSDSCKQRNIFPVISLSPVEIGLQFPAVNTGIQWQCRWHASFLSSTCWMSFSLQMISKTCAGSPCWRFLLLHLPSVPYLQPKSRCLHSGGGPWKHLLSSDAGSELHHALEQLWNGFEGCSWTPFKGQHKPPRVHPPPLLHKHTKPSFCSQLLFLGLTLCVVESKLVSVFTFRVNRAASAHVVAHLGWCT